MTCVISSQAFFQQTWSGGLSPLSFAVSSVIAGSANDQGSSANIENCMVVKGWRVIRLPDAEGLAFSHLDHGVQSDKLKDWIGMDPPHGQVARIWNNDISNTAGFELKRAGYFGNTSLSLLMISDQKIPRYVPPNNPRPHLTLGGLSEKQLGATSKDAAIVVIGLKDISYSHGYALFFEREKDESQQSEPSDILFGGTKNTYFVYSIKPGKWRMLGLGSGLTSLSLCLGSPEFELRAGQVIFMGTFDVYGPDIGPDMSLEPAKSFLGKWPDLQRRLSAAQWNNGSHAPCENELNMQNIYALEFKGIASRMANR